MRGRQGAFSEWPSSLVFFFVAVGCRFSRPRPSDRIWCLSPPVRSDLVFSLHALSPPHRSPRVRASSFPVCLVWSDPPPHISFLPPYSSRFHRFLLLQSPVAHLHLDYRCLAFSFSLLALFFALVLLLFF